MKLCIYLVNYRQFPAVLEALWLQLHHHRTHSPCLVRITLFFVCAENNKILLRKVIETFIPFYVFYLSIEMLFFCLKNKKKRTNQPTTANWTVNADFQLQMFSCCVLLSGNNKKQLLSDCFVLNFGCHCIVLSPDGEMCNIILKTLEHRVIMKAVAVKIFYCKIR